MTRERYISLREGRWTGVIVYAYYTHRCEELGLKIYPNSIILRLLDKFPEHIENILKISYSYFDIKFNITEVTRDGKLIKVI